LRDLPESLAADQAELVDKILQCMLMKKPEMYARYSEAGPARTREDVTFHIQHLVGALLADDPRLFEEYYGWLLGVLLPRGIIQEDIDINFSCMSSVLRDTYGDEASPALDLISRAVKAKVSE
jgi:hypothetical protein